MRPWLAWSTLVLAAAAATAAPRDAAAQDALNGGRVAVDFYLPATGKEASTNAEDYTKPTADVVERFLNGARCTCDRSGKTQQFLLKMSFAPDPTPTLGSAVPLTVFAGENCAVAETNGERAMRCSSLAMFANAADLVGDITPVFGRVGDLVAPGTVDGMPRACGGIAESSIFAVANALTATPLDATTPAVKVAFDLGAPTMPETLTVLGLEQTISVSWDRGEVDADTKYFQALCAQENGEQASPSSMPTARYDTTHDMCAIDIEPVEPATLTDGSVPSGTLPAALGMLEKRFICGEASKDAGSIKLEGLENDKPYWVVVLAIDSAGNYDARYIPHTVKPVPSIDFWEDANQDNPDINGGFCVAQVGRGGSGSGALLVLAAIVGAVRRRRRNGRGRARGAVLLGLGLLALAPATARAQDYDPYWIDSEAASTDRVDQPQWHLGLRLGPYHPSVDDGYSSDPGPFRRMFGPGYNLVPQLDLHRLWTVSTLQLGLGVSGGYYRKTADAYQIGSSPTDPMRPRSVGATNTFNMVPLSVTGIARLAVLDDRWGIPVVPYVRGGLAYNVWWVRTATGELAMTDCDTCKDKALGASAGLVGAVGIAIRGERLDGEASHSMRNGGVEHAGFYAELETSWVDGFGSGKRLSLGDTTWYAGVDFEF